MSAVMDNARRRDRRGGRDPRPFQAAHAAQQRTDGRDLPECDPVLRVPRLQPARRDHGVAADRRRARPSRKFGIGFLWTEEWDPVQEKFGALAPIVGTLVTSAIALAIAIPVSFGISIFLTELSPVWLRRPLGTAIEMLAAIPSIIYGMWGLFVFAPALPDPRAAAAQGYHRADPRRGAALRRARRSASACSPRASSSR